MSARLNARDRLARLLSVIPWVADHRDGVPIDDIVARFAYPRTQLLEDLQEIVFFVGVHPFTPDSLIEVDVSDDQVSILTIWPPRTSSRRSLTLIPTTMPPALTSRSAT